MEALADGEKTIQIKPDWGKVLVTIFPTFTEFQGYQRKGQALQALMKYEEAADAYEAGLKVEPSMRFLEAFVFLISALETLKSGLAECKPLADALKKMKQSTHGEIITRTHV